MTRNKVKNSLRASFWDGIFASCMMGFTTEFLTPYALALKASVSQIGALSALPNLFSSLGQLKSADVSERCRSKKKVIVSFVLVHTLMGIPIILIPYLFKGFEVIALIVCVTLFTSFNGFCLPVWLSLMSDYLPPRKRGSYFGWRARILGIVIVACMLSAGFILQVFKSMPLRGFLVIFSIAFVCRSLSWYFLTRMYEPPFHSRDGAYFSIIDFLRRAKDSNFARFVILAACLNFSVYLASPFFSVFMLRDLKFTYIIYTVLMTTVTLSSIFTIGRWGKISDKNGNLRVIKVSAFFIATIPLWWLLNHHPLYLLFIQILSGSVWVGFNLCAINFVYDAVTPAKRTRCMAYYNVCNGLAICLGSLLGGFLARNLPFLGGYRLLSLFLFSSMCRFAVAFLMRGIKEVRQVEHISNRELFYSMVGLRPMLE
jgi:MFS family permease